MIITVEGKTAKVEIGDILYSNDGSTPWESVQNLLLHVMGDYRQLERISESDLTPEALERKKLLQEIVE